MQHRSTVAVAAVVSGALALVLVLTMNARGIGMTPDGWAYWQGAVSIAEGLGYRYFSGNPILAWPPLYSAYLSIWVSLFGAVGATLIAANAALVALQATLWTALLASQVEDRERQIWIGAYLGIFIGLMEVATGADLLKYTMLPILLWASRTRGTLALTVAVLAALALVMTHNNGLAFVIGTSAATLLFDPRDRLRSAAILCAGVCGSILVRVAFSQAGSHPVGFGLGKESPTTYVMQVVEGIGVLLVPSRNGLPIVAAIALVIGASVLLRRASRAWRAQVLSAGVAVAFTFVLFNLTYVDNPIGGRFLWFVPITVVPFLLATLSRPFVRVVGTVLLIPLCYWAVVWIQLRASSAWPSPDAGFLPREAWVSTDYLTGPPVQKDGHLIVAPHNFEEPSR